jgi:hypothetical protein
LLRSIPVQRHASKHGDARAEEEIKSSELRAQCQIIEPIEEGLVSSPALHVDALVVRVTSL